MIHLHKWSKWGEPFDSAHSYVKLQERRCTECNKVQVKPISQPWNMYFPSNALKKGGLA